MFAPLLLQMEGRRALVVGAGKIGLRRAVTLVEAGCQVMVLGRSPEQVMPEGVTYSCHPYTGSADLEGMDIVIAATDDHEVNNRVVADCKAAHILCNRVDGLEGSDFIFPSVVRRGHLSLAVCTEGASPSLTVEIKKELAERYDESYTQRTALLTELRERILASDLDKATQRKTLAAVATMDIEALQKELEKV